MTLSKTWISARGFAAAGALTLTPFLCGFVLLGAKKSQLPATVASPTINFVWTGEAPTISDKDDFQGGAFQDLDDQAFMENLLQIALDQWNNVPGSFLKMRVTRGAGVLDKEDGLYSIVVEHSANLTTAAYAAPEIDDDQNVIKDCDINIADRKTTAKALAYTLVHEIGHCVGLGHNHSNYGAIMSYSRDSQNLRLGADDRAGLIFLYPDPAFGSDDQKELVSCGLITGRQEQASLSALAFLIMLPLLTVAYSLSRRLRLH